MAPCKFEREAAQDPGVGLGMQVVRKPKVGRRLSHSLGCEGLAPSLPMNETEAC